MSMNLIVIGLICFIAYSNDDSNNDRCSPRQEFTEDIKDSATNPVEKQKIRKRWSKLYGFYFYI